MYKQLIWESNEVRNAVRHVLVNELGLTRESIREEATAIIKQCVDVKIDSLTKDFKERIDKRIEHECLRVGLSDIMRKLRLDMNDKVNNWVDENIEISFKKSVSPHV